MFKRFIFIAIGVIILCFLGYNYVYKVHRNIAEEAPEYVLGAEELVKNFMENPKMAEKKYLNKTLGVKGKITALNANGLMLDKKVFCGFLKRSDHLKLQEEVVVKGRCIGFDELLGEVKLDQCSVYKK